VRVRQIEYLLDLLELFARERRPMTLTAMSRALRMPKSSTYNVIETLVARGYLYETAPRSGYYPTKRLAETAQQVMEGDPFLHRIHGELEALARDTGETVVLAVRDEQDVVYIDVVESTSLIRYFARIGDRRPLYTTSSGKAILMTYEAAQRMQILQAIDYIAHQKATKTSAAKLAADIEEAIARGWSEDRAETTPDVMALGVPILHGERRFGLAVAGPVYRIEASYEALAARLMAAAERIRATVRDA
jgi:DNA-binding IclR family transcriptional regulator